MKKQRIVAEIMDVSWHEYQYFLNSVKTMGNFHLLDDKSLYSYRRQFDSWHD